MFNKLSRNSAHYFSLEQLQKMSCEYEKASRAEEPYVTAVLHVQTWNTNSLVVRGPSITSELLKINTKANAQFN